MVYIFVIQHFRLFLHSSVRFAIPGKWEAPGKLDLKGQRYLKARKDSCGICAVAVPVLSPLSERDTAHVSWLSKGWEALWERGETQKESFSIRIGAWHKGAEQGAGLTQRLFPALAHLLTGLAHLHLRQLDVSQYVCVWKKNEAMRINVF